MEKNDDLFDADIFITPPDDGEISAEDSDNEDAPDVNMNHMAPAQLKAQAEVHMRTKNGTIRLSGSLIFSTKFDLFLG